MKERHVGTRKKSNRKYWLDRGAQERHKCKQVTTWTQRCFDSTPCLHLPTFSLSLFVVARLFHVWHAEHWQVGFLPSQSGIGKSTDGCVDYFFTDRMSENELKLILQGSSVNFLGKSSGESNNINRS